MKPPAPVKVFYNIEVEQGLLGAMLMNPESADLIIAEGLTADHFFEPIHARTFEVVSYLVAKQLSVTPMTVKTYLPGDIGLKDMTTSQYLAALAANATTAITAPDYARIIKGLFFMREARAITDEVDPAACNDVDEAVGVMFDNLDALRAGAIRNTRSRIMTAGEAASKVVEIMSNNMMRKTTPGVPTGLVDLDRVIGGMRAGQLILLGGRPGMGKSMVAGSITRSSASRGRAGAYFSLEMQEEELMVRMMTDHLYSLNRPIAYQRVLRDRDLPDNIAQAIIDAERDIQGLPLILDATPRMTVTELAARARGMAARCEKQWKRRLEFIVVDYLKMLIPTDRYRGNRVYELGEITGTLKMLAKELECTVLALSQLSRAVEARDDKRPRLADLRESGDLEADADVVLFAYREHYYLAQDPNVAIDPVKETQLSNLANLLELNVAKQRQGPTDIVKLYCHLPSGAVRSLAPGDVPAPMADAKDQDQQEEFGL